MAVTSRPGHQRGEPVEQLERGEGELGLAGGQGLGEAIADGLIGAVPAEPFTGEGGTGAVAQQPFEAGAVRSTRLRIRRSTALSAAASRSAAVWNCSVPAASRPNTPSVAWSRNNPESPLNVHADGGTVRVQVTAVSFLSPASGREDLAQVRFVRVSGEPGTEREQHYVATVQYAYATPSKDDRLRGANPLRFKVLEYRREPEVVETSAAAGARW
jgi:hypothetical protein